LAQFFRTHAQPRPVASCGRVSGAWPQVFAVYDGDQPACVCEQGAVHMVVGGQCAKFGGHRRLPVNLGTTEHGVTHGCDGRLRGFRK
jgi:hypothetical protein